MHQPFSNFPALLYITKQTFFVKGSWPNSQPFRTWFSMVSASKFSVKKLDLHLQCTKHSQTFQNYSKGAYEHFSWRVCDPIHNHLKLGSKWSSRIDFRLKIEICIYNAPITLKISKFILNNKKIVFQEGCVT